MIAQRLQRYKDEFANSPIILGTRGSLLALCQANHIRDRLENKGINVRLKTIKTRGDKILDVPLAKIGGKGLFTKELEEELLEESIDVAVHSLKDVPVAISPRLMLGAITKREDARDCFISHKFSSVEALPLNAKVGTTSLRRSVQLKMLRSDLDSINLRGNVQTRLEKLKSGEFDAIILATAGIKRLGIESEIKHIKYFEINEMLPAMGQGSLGLQCRDMKYFSSFRTQAVSKILESLHNKDAAMCCNIERSFIRILGGGCQSPIGIHAQMLSENRIKIACVVGNLSATKILHEEQTCQRGEVEYVIEGMINSLKIRGVDDILKEVIDNLSSGGLPS